MSEIFCHHTKSMSQEDIRKAFDSLDRDTWEASCKCCGTYYTGVFAQPESATKYACPKCEYDRNGIGSPAGGMNLCYMMDD